MRILRGVLSVAGALSIVMAAGCSSSPSSPSPILEPAQPPPSAEGGVAAPSPEATPAPAASYEKLLALLKSRGYDGIGLEYEAEPTLAMLVQVFSDPRSEGRKLKLIYTGLSMAYDRGHQSLTIGGTMDPEVILAFIQSVVPAASAPDAPPPPAAKPKKAKPAHGKKKK